MHSSVESLTFLQDVRALQGPVHRTRAETGQSYFRKNGKGLEVFFAFFVTFLGRYVRVCVGYAG
ncbi:hypothetical protein TPSea814_000865b [Treponema pallidum subsp. pallidum str. Sea 81-4]|nr:hypothetical protein TPSea814_000865b [Treponema pallidum subsp. pallidum str. Sea 81-4]